MLKKREHIEGVPNELQLLLDIDKLEATRQVRVEKAIVMLRNNRKTLKTVQFYKKGNTKSLALSL